MADVVSLRGEELAPCLVPDNAPALLRNIAEDIEAGKHGAVRLGVLVLVQDGGGCTLFGVGRDGGDMLAASGALAWGMAEFHRMTMAAVEDENG